MPFQHAPPAHQRQTQLRPASSLGPAPASARLGQIGRHVRSSWLAGHTEPVVHRRVWESTDPTSPCGAAPSEQRAALEVAKLLLLAVNEGCETRHRGLVSRASDVACYTLILTYSLTDLEAISHGRFDGAADAAFVIAKVLRKATITPDRTSH